MHSLKRHISLILSLLTCSFVPFHTIAQTAEQGNISNNLYDDRAFDVYVNRTDSSYVVAGSVNLATSTQFIGTMFGLSALNLSLPLQILQPPMIGNGGTDGYLAKMNFDGSLQWIVNFGGAGQDEALAVTVGADNRIYVAGYYHGSATFRSYGGGNPITLTSEIDANMDIFLACYTQTGQLIWAKDAGGGNDDAAYDIANLSDGIVIAGTVNDQAAKFDSFDVYSGNNTGDHFGVFTAKYDFNGNVQWLNTALSTSMNEISPDDYSAFSGESFLPIRRVQIDVVNDEVVIAARVRGSQVFYNNTATSSQTTGSMTGNSNRGLRLSRLSSSGVVLANISNSANPVMDQEYFGFAMAADCQNIYVSLSVSTNYSSATMLSTPPASISGSNPSSVLASYNLSDLLCNRIHVLNINGNLNESYPTALISDRLGAVYLTGIQRRKLCTVELGCLPGSTPNNNEVYFYKFNTTLNSTNYWSITGNAADWPGDLDLFNNRLWLAGWTQSSTINLLSGVLPISSNRNAFVSRYQATPLATVLCCNVARTGIITAPVSAVCPGVNFTLSAANTNGALQWLKLSSDGVTWLPISGATTNVLVDAITTNSRYRLRATTNCGVVVSSDIIVSVINYTPPSWNIDLIAGSSCNAPCPDLVTNYNNVGCGTYVQYPTAGTNLGLGINSVYVVHTGTQATVTYLVNVLDTTNPSITCPANINVNLTSGCTTAVIYNVTATDNCSNAPSSIPGFTALGVYNGHTYFASIGAATWYQAHSTAASLGGHLVTISSAGENAFMPTTGDTFWIGLTDAQTEGEFRWVNNEPFTFNSWAMNEPNNLDTENFVALYFSGQHFWNDQPATVAHRYIIEFDSVNSTPALTLISGQISGSQFSLGTTSIIYQATDNSGNTSNCTFNVTVTDNTTPIITCPGVQTLSVTSGCTIAIPSYTALVSVTDNCPNITFVQTPPAGTIVNINTTQTIQISATDIGGNTASCSFTLNVVDSSPPTITCPGTQTLSRNSACQGILPDYRSLATANDNCLTGLIISQLPAPGTTISNNTTVQLIATDAAGLTASCSFSVSLVDNTGPTLACPGNQTLNLNSNCTILLPDYRSLCTVSDNCSAPAQITLTQYPVAGATIGSNTLVVITATDQAGNFTTCSLIAQVVDNIAPIIVCPTTINTTADGGSCGAVVNYNVTATDNCNNIPSALANYTFFGIYNNHTYYVSNTAKNWLNANIDAMNTGGHLVTITTNAENLFLPTTPKFWIGATDQYNEGTFVWNTGEPFVFTAWNSGEPNNQSNEDYAVTNHNLASRWNDHNSTLTFRSILEFDYVTTTPDLTLISGLPSGSVFPVGSTTVTYSATDASGNTSTCSFMVNVTDNTPPTITCPAAQTLVLNASCAGTLPDYRSLATVADNCTATGSLVVTQSPVAGTVVSGVGTTVVTLTVTDESGNSTNCTFNVNKVDNTPPIISCPGDMIISCGESTDPTNTGFATAIDNCSAGTTITWSDAPSLFIPSVFPGSSAIQARARWGVAGYEAGLFIGGTVGPQLNPPGAPVWNLGAEYSFEYSYDMSSGTQSIMIDFDTNGTYETNEIITQNTPFAGQGFKHFSIYLDGATGSGNAALTLGNFTVNGYTLGNYNTPAGGNAIELDWENSNGYWQNLTATGTIKFTGATGFLMERPRVWFRFAEPTTNSTIPTCSLNSTINRIWSAEDSSGNRSYCMQIISEQDSTAPIITGTLPVGATGINACFSNIPTGPSETEIASAFSDNCGTVHVTKTGTPNGNDTSWSVTYVYTIRDDCSNFATPVSITYSGGDQTSPTIICPSNQLIFLNASCAGTLSDYRSLATVADNCTATGSLVVTQSPAAGTAVSGVGTTVVTLTVTDASGNSTNCTFNVNRVDNTPPTITCPAAQTLALNASCEGTLGDYRSLATAADNCTPVGLLVVTQSPAAGTAVSGVGTTVVTLIVTDTSGNTTNCTFNVNRVDNTPPTITCPAAQTLVLNASCTGTLGDYRSLATVADNCTATGSLVVTQSPAAGTAVSGVGTTIVTLTVTDTSGNTTNCTFNVNRVDNTPPTITCPAAQTLALNASCAGTLGDYRPLATVADNCTPVGSLVVTQSPAAGSAVSGVGTTVVTLTVTDASGNTTNCTFNVIRVDNTAPAITCPAAQTLVLNASCAGTLGDYRSLATLADNCTSVGSLVVTQSPAAGTAVSGVGTTVVTLTVTDASGNSSNCAFNVNRVDNTPPTIICPSQEVVTIQPEETEAFVNPGIPVVLENCSSYILSNTYNGLSNASGIYPVGLTNIIWTAQDASGLETQCTTSVLVTSLEIPEIDCENSILSYTSSTSCDQYIALEVPIVNSTTEIINFYNDYTNTTNASAIYPIGSTLITWYATDINDITGSCTTIVTVMDTIAPIILCPLQLNTVSSASDCTGWIEILIPQITENCSLESVFWNTTNTGNASGMYPVGSTPIIWTATDIHGNVGTCQTNIVVIDNVVPEIICPPAILTIESCHALMPDLVSSLSVWDNCSTIDIIMQSVAVGMPVDNGQSIWVYAIDAAGNESGCEVTIITTDVESPVIISCPQNQSDHFDEDCQFVIPDYRPLVIAEDQCDSQLIYLQSPAPGTIINADEAVVDITVAVYDSSLNSSVCGFSITLSDTISPTIVCASNQIVIVEPLQTSAEVTVVSASATDNCSAFTLSNSINGTSNASGIYPLGITEVLWTATDSAGNISTCSTEIHVLDNAPPQIDCIATIETFVDESSCGAQVDIPIPSVQDSNGILELYNSQNNSIDASGFYAVGNYEIIWTVVDSTFNTNYCVTSLSVRDTISPIVLCLPSVTVYTDGETCESYVNFELPEMSDNCNIASITNSYNGTYDASDIYSVGDTIIYWIVSDIFGNTTFCNVLVTVVNPNAPFITCVQNQLIEPGTELLDYTALLQINDNCELGETIIQSPPQGTIVTENTTVALTWLEGGQSCSFEVIVSNSTEAPILICPGDLYLNSNTDCGAILPDLTTLISNEEVYSTLPYTVYQSPEAGSVVFNGDQLELWVENSIGVMSNVCTTIIWVNDSVAPTATNPLQQISLDVNSTCTLSLEALATQFGFTDNCSTVTVIEQYPNPSTILSLENSPINAWITVTDESGNAYTHEFTLMLLDTTAPVVSLGSNFTIYLDQNCEAVLPSELFQLENYIEDCSNYNYYLANGTLPNTIQTAGQHQYHFNIEDVNGNTTSWTAIIDVLDTIAPVIIPINAENYLSTCDPDMVLPYPSIIDCSENVSVQTLYEGPLSLGVNVINYQATDAYGNTSEYTLTIELLESPSISWLQLASQICQLPELIDIAISANTAFTLLLDGQIQPSELIDLSELSIGSHLLSITASNSNCTTSYNQQFEILVPPVITYLTNEFATCNDHIEITITNSDVQIQWQTSEPVELINTNSSTVTVNSEIPGIYEINVEVSNSICSVSDTIEVNFMSTPIIDAGDDEVVHLVNQTTLNGSVTGTSNYFWSNLNTNSSIESYQNLTTNIIGLTPGDNLFLLTAQDGPCVATDTVNIQFIPLVIPTGFSPNDDGVNDTFEVKGIDKVTVKHLHVYSRWGQLLYENDSYNNDWSGDNKNGPLPDDTYFYDLRIEDKQYQGYVIIKRD